MAKVKEALERRRRKQRVLVVDDDANIRSTLARMLTMAGYEAVLAADGDEATRLWRERPADLVIALSSGAAGINLDLPDAKLLAATVTIEKPFMPAEVMQLVDAALLGSRKRGRV